MPRLPQTDYTSPGGQCATTQTWPDSSRVEVNHRAGLVSFQYYPANVRTNTPLGMVTLDYFLRAQQSPKQKTIDVFKQIAECERTGDAKRKAELKQGNLYYFTPCVLVNGYRRYANINLFTGLLVIDFDHIDNADDLKKFLFEEYHQIIAAWLSPSRRGVKCIIQIPKVSTVQQFKEYYYGVACEMDQYAGFDPSGQNAVLPLFQSWDAELLRRDDAELWTVKGVKINDLDTKPIVKAPVIEVTDKDKETCLKMIETGFKNITDYGHPPLRSLCISIGGYVASGYISEFDALQAIYYQIESHGYLKKGIPGYKQTAKWALGVGYNKPLKLSYGS